MPESAKGGAAVAEPLAVRKSASSAQGPEPEGSLATLTAPLESRKLAWIPPADPSQGTGQNRNLLRVGPVTLTGDWNDEQIAPVAKLLGQLLPQLDITSHPFELKITSSSEALKQRGARGSAGLGKIELHSEDALHESARQRYLLAHEAAHIAQQRRQQSATAFTKNTFDAEIEAHEIASAFSAYRSVAPPRVSSAASRILFDADLEVSLKEQVARSRATEIEEVKKQLKGWVWASDVHRTLLVLQSVDFFVARAIMQNVEPEMRIKFVNHLDGNDAIRFRTEVFAAYSAMEAKEINEFGIELFEKVDLHELTPHELYAAQSVLQKIPDLEEKLKNTKNAFAIRVIKKGELTNEAISNEQLQKAQDQEGQAEKKNTEGTQKLSPKEEEDYKKVADKLSKRFFFFPPSQANVLEALQLLSTYRTQPDRMRLLAVKLDKAGLLDRLVEHVPIKSLIQEQLTESSADGKSGPVLLPTFLTLVSFRPAYRNVALAEELTQQGFFRRLISGNSKSELAFLALQLVKSAPDRMKESFAGDYMGDISSRLDDDLRENEGVSLYGGGLHQADRAKIEAALMDDSLWNEKRLSELNARIRMAHAANERRFVFDQSAKFKAWQRDGLLPLVEKYSLYNPDATGPDGKRQPRTTFVAQPPTKRTKDRSLLGAVWNILGTVKIRENGLEVTNLDLLDVQRIAGGDIAGIELAGSKGKSASAQQPNRIQQFIWNSDTRQFQMIAELIEIASVHRLGATRIDTGPGTVSGISLKGVLDGDKNLKNITANIARIKLGDIAVTTANGVATIEEVEVSGLEFRLGAELDYSTLPKVEISGQSDLRIPIIGPFLNPIITLIKFGVHAYRGVKSMIKALQDMPQIGLRIGGVKVRGVYSSSGEHVDSLDVSGVEVRYGTTLEGYQAELRAAAKALEPALSKAENDLRITGPDELEARMAASNKLQKRMDTLTAAIAQIDKDKAELKNLEAKEKKDGLTDQESEHIKELRRGGALLSVASVQVSGVGGQLSAKSISLEDVGGMGRTSGEKDRPVLTGKATSADFKVTAGCFTAVNAGWKSAPEDSLVLGAQVDKLKAKIANATKAGESTAPLQVKLQLLQSRLSDTVAYEKFAERGIATLTPEEAAQYRLLIQKLSDTTSVSADKVEVHDMALGVLADNAATTGSVEAGKLTITGVHYRRTETSLREEELQLEAIEKPTSAQKRRLEEVIGALRELQSLRNRLAENAAALEKARGTKDEASLKEQKANLEAGLDHWSHDQRVAESVEVTGPHVTVKAAGGLVGGDKTFDQLMDDGLHISGGFQKLEIKKPEFRDSSGGKTTDTKAADITAGPFEATFDTSKTGVSIENLSLANLDVTGLEYKSSENNMKASGNISLRGLIITKGHVIYEDEIGPSEKDKKDAKPDDKKSEVKKKATTLHCDELRIASISGNSLAFSKSMDDGQKLNVKVPHGSFMAILLKDFKLTLPTDGGDMQESGHAEIGKTEISGLNAKVGQSLEASASINAGKISADFASGGKTTVNLNDFNVINAHLHQAGKGTDVTDVQFEITHVSGKVVLNSDGNIDIDMKPTIGVQLKTMHWKSGAKELTSEKPVILESMEVHAVVHKQPGGSIRDVTIRNLRVSNITAEALRYQDAESHIDLKLDQTLADKDKKAFSIREVEMHEFVYSMKKGIVSGDITANGISAAVSGDFADQVKGGLRLDAKSITAHFFKDGAFATDIDGLSGKFKGSAEGASLAVNLDGFSAFVYMKDDAIVVNNLGLKALNLSYLNFDSPDYRISMPEGAGHAQVKALAADFVILLNPPPVYGPPEKDPPSRVKSISIKKFHIDEITAAGLELEIKDKPVGDKKAGASTLIRLPDNKPLTLSGIDIEGPDRDTPFTMVTEKGASSHFLGGLKVETADLKQLQVATANSFQLKTAIHAGGIKVDFLKGDKKRISVQTLSVTDLNALIGEKSSTDPTQFAANFDDPSSGITVKVASAHIAQDPLKPGDPPLVVDPDGSASLSQLIIDDAQFSIPDLMELTKDKPPKEGEAKDAAPAGPAFDLQDWKFVDTLQGWIRADVEYSTSVKNLHFSLLVNVKDGKFPAWETLDRLEGSFLGIFGKLEIQDKQVALVLDLSSIPDDTEEYAWAPPRQKKFNIVEVPLTPEEMDGARRGVLPLAALRNARLGEDAKSPKSPDDDKKPKDKPSKPVEVPDDVKVDIAGDLYTAGQSVINLGPAGKIILGPEGYPGMSHLTVNGHIQPKRENVIDIALKEANVGLENFKIGGVGLNLGRLSIEGVKDTKLGFAKGEAIPKSLKGTITKATANNVKIDFAELMKKKTPDPTKGGKP